MAWVVTLYQAEVPEGVWTTLNVIEVSQWKTKEEAVADLGHLINEHWELEPGDCYRYHNVVAAIVETKRRETVQ